MLSIDEGNIQTYGLQPTVVLAKIRSLSDAQNIYLCKLKLQMICNDLGLAYDTLIEDLAILGGLGAINFYWESNEGIKVYFNQYNHQVPPDNDAQIDVRSGNEENEIIASEINWTPSNNTLSKLRQQGIKPTSFKSLVVKYVSSCNTHDDTAFVRFCLLDDESRNVKRNLRLWRPADWILRNASNDGLTENEIIELTKEFKSKRLQQTRVSENLDLEFERFLNSKHTVLP